MEDLDQNLKSKFIIDYYVEFGNGKLVEWMKLRLDPKINQFLNVSSRFITLCLEKLISFSSHVNSLLLMAQAFCTFVREINLSGKLLGFFLRTQH